ncbi:hypothetical protein SCHPADRAFT_1001468 [Schizopora paradoxa]|uniref:F-box domain-containing protein n=1 Tax=Schizopora paradoxa TaxID=27342 RepID=A0A0H2R790_9AGAM|nr:hypothetical protein SCHPADRAFT_1001468 [Schizopora paradoxa]
MGWSRIGGDEEELCKTLDYVLDGLTALRTSIRKGQRLDGTGERKVDLKEIWCPELSRFRSSDDVSITADIAKAALWRMKIAKKLLLPVLESLDESIQEVTEVTANDCRAAGLIMMPNDVLANVFKIYIDMIPTVLPAAYEEYHPLACSPLILSSVSRRFRQIVLYLPSLWRHIALNFPDKLLLLHKNRCPNPIIHIKPARNLSFTYFDKLDALQPHHQWRELHLHFASEDHARFYFKRLGAIVQAQFHSLERLSISNDVVAVENEPDYYGPSIYLDEENLDVLSSWRMPKLSFLELRNAIPITALRCENVTWLSFELSDLYHQDEVLDMVAFRDLLQSMPKIQSLLVTFDMPYTFDEFADKDTDISSCVLPSLKFLDLKIRGQTPDLTVRQFMGLVETQKLSRLAVELRGGDPTYDPDFQDWVSVIFPEMKPGYVATFSNVEDFALAIRNFRWPSPPCERILTSMPNVQAVSFVLPYDSDFYFSDRWKKDHAFPHLRSLQIEVLPINSYESPLCQGRFDAFHSGQHCKTFELLEMKVGSPHFIVEERDRLQSLLGEKLHWIEY